MFRLSFEAREAEPAEPPGDLSILTCSPLAQNRIVLSSELLHKTVDKSFVLNNFSKACVSVLALLAGSQHRQLIVSS